MRKLVACVCVLMALAVLTLRADSAMVVLISIDGFAAYHLKNAELDLPNIRALAAAGVEADSSETVFPSVTHPSHTTLVTGVLPRRHGVLSNRVTNRITGERFHVTNLRRTDIVQVPTLFDAAKDKGFTTAAFYWPETRDDPSIDYNVPEVFAAENVADIDAVPPAVMADLRDAGVPIDDYYAYYGDSFLSGTSDFALAKAAAHAITTRQPALTAIHFLMTDVVQHEVGPEHYRSRAALTTADAAVGILVNAVQEAGLTDRTTFIVGADHGFATIEWQVNVAPAFAGFPIIDKVNLHPQGWSLFVELKPEFETGRDQAALDEVLARALEIDGVARVVRPDEFHALGLPTYDESPYIRGHYMIVGEIDTFVAYEPDNASTDRTRLPEAHHSHGYLPDHPKMYPSLVLSGRGIARGKTIGHVRNVDVAPTIARLLGLELPDMDGRVLTEALR